MLVDQQKLRTYSRIHNVKAPRPHGHQIILASIYSREKRMLLETIQDENLGIPEYQPEGHQITTPQEEKIKIIWKKEGSFSPLEIPSSSGTSRKMS